MAGPQPITGMSRFVATIGPEAPPEKMHGGPVKKAHSSPGEQAQPYPWEEFAGPHGPYGPAENELLSDLPESQTFAAGTVNQDPSGDLTPYRTHAGPNIRGMEMDRGPDGNARVLIQSAIAHGVKTGAARKGIQSSNPLEDQWTGFYNSVPGDDQLPAVPGQVGNQAAGFGVNDHTSNAYAKRNTFGLHASHRYRRYATGSIPGNYMWMRPGGRMMSKTVAGPARPAIGEGPFYGQDMTRDYGIQGVILMDPSTEYVAPPQPYVTPATQSMDNAPVIELF
jgi:hypothetical protein